MQAVELGYKYVSTLQLYASLLDIIRRSVTLLTVTPIHGISFIHLYDSVYPMLMIIHHKTSLECKTLAEFLERHHEVIHLVTTASPFLNVLQFPAGNRLLPQHFHLPEKQIFPSRHNYSYPGEISGMAQLMDVFVEIVIVLLNVYCLQLYIYIHTIYTQRF